MLAVCLARRHGAVSVSSCWDSASSATIGSCRVIGVSPVLAGFSDLFHQDWITRLRHVGLAIDLVGEGAEWREVARLDRQPACFQGAGDTLLVSEATIAIAFGRSLGGGLKRR